MPPVRGRTFARTALTDPVVGGLGLTTAAVLWWLLDGPGDLTVDTLVRAVAGLLGSVVLVVSAARLVRRPAGPAADRRFWRAVTVMGFLVLAGHLGRLVATLRHPGPEVVASGRFQIACVLAGIAVLVGAALTHPRPPVARPIRLRYLLDTVAVVAAAVVLARFMAERSAALGTSPAVSLAPVVVAVAVTFAVTRLAVGGAGPLRPVVAVLLVTAAVAQCGNGGVLPGTAGPRMQLVLQVLAVALISAGPRLQELADRAGPAVPARQRTASVLPYAMLAVVLAILPAVLTPRPRGTALLALGGLVLITAVVVVRQILIFAEHEALVGRYDAGLQTVGRQEERVRLLLEYSTDITTLTDHTGTMTYLTPATRALGYEPADLVGTPVVALIHPEDLPALTPGLRRLLATPGETYTYQARYRHADGSWRWLEVTSRNLTHEPSVAAVVSNARDVTDARELQDRLRHEATHDALTGLANRVLFGRRLATEMVTGGALLLIDLDGFKAINDTYGHHTGDAVLIGVAERLRAAVPAGAVPARLGGDEFAVLLPRAGTVAADLVAERFRAALAEPVEVDGRLLTIGASIGVVAGTGVDPEALLRRADEAMYRVKHATSR